MGATGAESFVVSASVESGTGAEIVESTGAVSTTLESGVCANEEATIPQISTSGRRQDRNPADVSRRLRIVRKESEQTTFNTADNF